MTVRIKLSTFIIITYRLVELLVEYIFAAYFHSYYLIKHNIRVNINIDLAVTHFSQEECNNDTFSRIWRVFYDVY